MKKLAISIVCALLALSFLSTAHADLCSMYDVNISDANQYRDGNTLFQLFNRYFADQLDDGGLYSSSNDLFNDRGVDPNSQWTTSGSSLVGAFKVAAFGHEMSVVSKDGTSLGSIIDVAGTTNINDANGITDLSTSDVVSLPDGVNIDFQLSASLWGADMYEWSSDPTKNEGDQPGGVQGDGQIHMVSLDITDLYNEKYGTDYTSVYMLAWEDLHLTGAGLGNSADWDYQDFVAIVTNIQPTPTSTTPEPSTMLMFLMGGATSVLAYRKRKRCSL